MARPQINNHVVTGNIANEPQKMSREDGSYLVVFNVAESSRYFDREAQQWAETDPVYYGAAIDSKNGKLADNVFNSMGKGDRITLEGNYTAQAGVNQKTGEPVINHRLWVNDASASLRFATVDITRNERSGARMEAGMDRGAQMQQSAQQSAPSQSHSNPEPSWGAGNNYADDSYSMGM